MLQTGSQGNHGQVVGVHDGIDITGETQGEGSQGDTLGQTAAGGRTLDVHGRSTGRLTNGGANVLTDFTQALNQTHGGGGFTFAQGSGGDGGYVDVFTIGFVFQTFQNLAKIDFCNVMTLGKQLFLSQAEFFTNFIDGEHRLFSVFCNLPVSMFGRI